MYAVTRHAKVGAGRYGSSMLPWTHHECSIDSQNLPLNHDPRAFECGKSIIKMQSQSIKIHQHNMMALEVGCGFQIAYDAAFVCACVYVSVNPWRTVHFNQNRMFNSALNVTSIWFYKRCMCVHIARITRLTCRPKYDAARDWI